MKAAVVVGRSAPVYRDFRPPTPTGEGVAVEMRAAALTNLDILVAERRHYFSSEEDEVVVGREGVADVPGKGRCFLTATSMIGPFGSMAEAALVRPQCALPVPGQVSDVEAAGIGNSGLAAWLPLSWRAQLRPGEVVLVLGATGASGLMAVFAAKRLGASRVIAVGRNPAALDRAREVGADAALPLGGGDLAAALRDAADGPVDVVLDYLNGAAAEAAFAVMGLNARMVQIGAALGSGFFLNAQVARRSSLAVLGFAYYHAPLSQQAEAYAALCEEAQRGALPLRIAETPLSRIGEAWDAMKRGDTTRRVLTP